MSELGEVWAAMELIYLDFGQWPTVIVHSELFKFVEVHNVYAKLGEACSWCRSVVYVDMNLI